MSRVIKILIGVIVLFLSLVVLTFSYYVFQLTPTSNEETVVEVEIPKGATGIKVGEILKEHDLIRNVMVFKMYLKIHNIKSMSYGVYELNKAMGVKQIVDIIAEGKVVSNDIEISFIEGQNIRAYAKTIANNTNNSEEDVFRLLKDEKYIDSLIDEYWFLTDEIKKEDIYYPLEGYLAPNTYRFASKDVTVDEIFKRLLNQMDRVLTPYKNNIKDYTIHEFLTLASVVQSEGIGDEDWPSIASVFYNRLDQKMSFGSCVTACYAAKIDSCTSSNVPTSIVSPYNTYLSSMAGKLPIGPISNPGAEAINATATPATTDYLFFVSDAHRKTYFSKTHDEHKATIARLKALKLWLED